MARPEKTEPLLVCVDADVLIAGLLSRTGASHAILVLGELGLLRLVLPEAAVAEVTSDTSVRAREYVSCDQERSSRKPARGWDPSEGEVIYRPTRLRAG